MRGNPKSTKRTKVPSLRSQRLERETKRLTFLDEEKRCGYDGIGKRKKEKKKKTAAEKPPILLPSRFARDLCLVRKISACSVNTETLTETCFERISNRGAPDLASGSDMSGKWEKNQLNEKTPRV